MADILVMVNLKSAIVCVGNLDNKNALERILDLTKKFPSSQDVQFK